MDIGAELRRRFAQVRLLSLDLDGVMTDGGVYYAETGEELRRYDIKDGTGIVRLREAGFHLAVITNSRGVAIERRMQRLGIQHFHMGIADKLPVLRSVAESLGFGLDAVAHIADDVNDLTALRAVGLALAPADAVPEVLAVAHYITKKNGGRGAVREVCEMLLEIQKSRQGSVQQ